jgi:SAM-dependent methyltransferase
VKHWNEMSSRWHEDYERGRPGYPPSAVRVLDAPDSASVLELGAGTGKLTRLLLQDHAEVLAIEPDPQMRRWLAAVCPEAVLVAGTAEAIPLADQSVDAVFSAEAFHWFAHDRALAEICRVMRPDGTLVLMWNRPAGRVEPPITAVEHLLEPLWPEDIEMPLDLDPRRWPHAREWPTALADSAFEPLREMRFPNTQVVDPDGLAAFFGSMGWIGSLPDDDRSHVLDELRSQLTAAEYRMPFETYVYRTQLGRHA